MPSLIIPLIQHVIYLCKTGSIMYVVMFVFDRIYTLYKTAVELSASLQREETLRQKCTDPAFYMMLADHKYICDKVHENARRSVILEAIEIVMQSTYVCGYDRCEVILGNIVQWLVGLSFPVLLLIGALAVIMPCAFIHITRALSDVFFTRNQHILYNPYHTDVEYGWYTNNHKRTLPLLYNDNRKAV